MLFSILLGFRNRDYQRVKNSLDSLSRQKTQNFEVVFVDYGSGDQIGTEIKTLVKSYAFCRYIYTETRGRVWSRAHALNTGLRLAEGDYVIFSDIDLIFPANFTELLTQFLSDRTFLTHRCYYLPECFNVNSNLNDKLEDVPVSYVGLLLVSKGYALKIHGFDEFYQIWGAEDDDFIARLERAGLQRRVIDVNDIPVYHQWHHLASPKKPTPWYLAELNYLYLNSKSQMDGKALSEPEVHGCDGAQPSIKRNDFGRILNIKDRPALNAYLNGSYKNSPKLRIREKNHLAYLDFYKEFSTLQSGEICFFEDENRELIYDQGKMKRIVESINKFLDKLKKFHYRLVREERIKMSSLVTFQDVKDFIEFFIGVNRPLIQDYYYSCDHKNIILILIKV